MNHNPHINAKVRPGPAGAVAKVKAHLQHEYEWAYPQLAEIIHLVIDEEEANARELSFPQLFLPDLVAAHIEKLNLKPVDVSQRKRSTQQVAATLQQTVEFGAQSTLRAA